MGVSVIAVTTSRNFTTVGTDSLLLDKLDMMGKETEPGGRCKWQERCVHMQTVTGERGPTREAKL